MQSWQDPMKLNLSYNQKAGMKMVYPESTHNHVKNGKRRRSHTFKLGFIPYRASSNRFSGLDCVAKLPLRFSQVNSRCLPRAHRFFTRRLSHGHGDGRALQRHVLVEDSKTESKTASVCCSWVAFVASAPDQSRVCAMCLLRNRRWLKA